MAAHPHHFTIPGFCIPPPPAEADVALEPRPEAEGQADPPPEEPTFLVEIDYAGNFIARPVAPLTLRPAAPTETPSVLSRDPEPEQWPRPPTPAYPPLGPMLDPHPNEPRPDDLRRVAPPGPRRARGGPPPLGPRSAARGMDPLAPEFTRNLVSKTARIMAGMDRVMRPGGIATPEGLSAAVRAGMQHLAAHQGDVTASIASVKAAGTASHKPDQTPPRHGSVLEGTKPAAATATVVTPVQASGAVETKFRASGLVEYHSHADRDITHTTDSVGDHSIGATLGGWIGGALGTEAGATIGAAAGSVIGPEGTFVGGIAGGRIGGRIGSKGGAALGSVIEKAIIIAVSGSD